MAFIRNINDFILTLVALSLPSIAANIDCNGKPFHCLNSTHFLICVDFGSGISSTMDDFVIPCPPTTVCQATNRFECEFLTVTTTTVSPVVTNLPLAATVNNDVVIDTVSDVTTIPFEEYLNTISTTTLSESNLFTQDSVITELPVNNQSESFNEPATDSNINETAINVDVSPKYFTTLATLDIATDETTVTELIPNVAKYVNVIFEPDSNISEALPDATEFVPRDIALTNLSENNTFDVTENYESNSTLLETIIGATTFRQFNTSLYNSTYDVTVLSILSEATENIISIPIDDKQVYLTTLEAPPDVLDNKTTENVTESISTMTTEYKNLIQFQSNSTLNETGDIVHNDPTPLNTVFETNLNNSDNEITAKYEEQISTAEPVLFEAKHNTTNIPVDDKQVYLPTLAMSPDVILDDQTIDNATEFIPAETTEYKLREFHSNQFNKKPPYKSTTYDFTKTILSDVTESVISIPVDDKPAQLSTFDSSKHVILGDQTINNVTEIIQTQTKDYKHLIKSQINSTLNETVLGGDIVQNKTIKLNTVLNTNESALNVNNSELNVNEINTKYDEQVSTAEPILYKAKENKINILVDDKHAYLTTLDALPDVFLDNKTIDAVTKSIPTEMTLDASPDVFLDNKTIDAVTKSIPTETTEYRPLTEFRSNSILNAIMSNGGIKQNYTITVTVLNINESASNGHNSNLSLNEEQTSTAGNNSELSGTTGTEIIQPDLIDIVNITKPKFRVSKTGTTTVNTEPKSTNTTNEDAVGEVTEKFNIFDDKRTFSEHSVTNTSEHTSVKPKDINLISTEHSVTSISDNTSVKPKINTNTTQSDNLSSVNYMQNITKTETETEEIHLVYFSLPKLPRSNETTTIVHGNHSTADNTSTTNTISNIDATIAKSTLNDITASTDEAQKIRALEVNVNDKTADAIENNHLLQPVTEPTGTPLSNIAHNILDSDLINEKPQETSTFINRIELTARGNVANQSLTQNGIGSDMNPSTEINVFPSNHIELNNRVSVSTEYDQANTAESTPNYILDTVTQKMDSFTYSNVYYQTDIEDISHDQGVSRNKILSADIIESSSLIFVLTTESPKEPHFDAVLQAITLPNSVIDKMYTAESDTYLTSTTHSSQPEATPSTAFDSINSADDTFKPITRKNEIDEIVTESLKLEITSAISENSYVTTEQNILSTDMTNSPHQTAITSSTEIVYTNSAVNQVKQVTRQAVDEKISTESSTLPISFTINETVYAATEQNIPSKEVTSVPSDLIPDRFKYTTTTETANDAVHKKSRITITSDSTPTKPSESSTLRTQNNPKIKETLLAITTSNTAEDLLAMPNLILSNYSGITNFAEEKNGITVADALTTETTEDAISEASTDKKKEKYPIAIKKEDMNPENIGNSIKTDTTTKDIKVTEDTKHNEPLHSYSIHRENISKLEITSIVTDQTTLDSLIADDVNYIDNQNNLADTQDRVLSNAPAESNIPETLSERFGANVYDPDFSVNKATFIDGLTSMNTAVAADMMLTRDENNQESPNKLDTPKTSTTETLNESLKEKDALLVIPVPKIYSESIVKIANLNGDINANPKITNETSSFDSHTEHKLSFTTSIQESKYESTLPSSTESWRAPVVTEPVVHPTRLYTDTLITSSKSYTESNVQMSQDVENLTSKLNLANPSEKQYINLRQNIEPATKTVLTSLEPSVIFSQVTEPSGVANQDGQSSSVRNSMTQKSYRIDTLKLFQNQGESSTEKYFINFTPLASLSTTTNPMDISKRQSFTAPNTQILTEHHVFKNGEQIEVPTAEKLKVNVTPIMPPSVKANKPLVDVTALPILKSSNNISKAKTHLIKTMYNSNYTLETVPITEFNQVQLNITSTTKKTTTQSFDPDIVMVDVVKTNSPNMGEIVNVSKNTHLGISAIPKSTSRQVEKHKTSKSPTEDEHETEKAEKPEVATLTESIPINKQANVQHNPPINTKHEPVQNIASRIKPVDSDDEDSTARSNTKTKSSFPNKDNSTAETSKHNFVCKPNNRGRFSDKGDCGKFYICIGKHEPIKGICPNNTVFSELRKQCTKNLSHCVRNNQFQCLSEGRFSDYLIDNIYYICVINKANRFIRFKLQCQEGYHLNKTSVRCVLNTESILSTSEQSREVSTSITKSEKLKEKLKTNKKFKCKRSGKFPEQNDCRKYYVCTKLGKSEYRQRNKKCDSDEVYNRDKKKCVDADSYRCS